MFGQREFMDIGGSSAPRLSTMWGRKIDNHQVAPPWNNLLIFRATTVYGRLSQARDVSGAHEFHEEDLARPRRRCSAGLKQPTIVLAVAPG